MFVATETADWLEELNPEQRAAALHRDGHLLVLAGAGTGKTTTLCARVASLVAGGVPAERILLLTFTRRASRDMLTRAQAMAGGCARRVLGGTFHSVGHRFVRGHAAALGLGTDFAVLDAGDAADLLDLVRQEQGHGETGRRFPRKHTLADIYSRTVNAQRPVREIVAESFPWCEEHLDVLGPLFQAFTARKRALGAIDLDDLLLLWRALMADEQAGAHIASSFDHVLVDEYQDVNGLQVAIVEGFARRGCRVTAVGDDFQAIYAFRSASARHILDFPDRFTGATTVTLERNYRATQPLLDVANAVAEQDVEGYPKILRAVREGGTRPALVHCRDQLHEATEICDRVLAARGGDAAARAGRARAHRARHDALELELSRRRVPFVKYGGLRYLEAAHVKDFLAVLRLVDRPADEMAWFRVLQLLDGVGPARARRAVDRLVADPAGWAGARAELPTSALELADALVAAIADAGDKSPGPAVEGLRDALAPLVRGHYVDGAVRVPDLDTLAGLAGDARDVRTFVAEVVLDPPASTQDLAGPPQLDEDWLVLSTVHSAKGLEWQSVHLVAAYDGNFPADMAAGTSESIAEERRLMYVALTRARRSLSVYVPRRYYRRPQGRDDGHGYGKASRFLTAAVQAVCDVTHLPDDPRGGPFAAAPGPPRRITVSVDDLFA